MFDYTNENMQLKMSETTRNYRKKEMRLKLYMQVFSLIYVAGVLYLIIWFKFFYSFHSEVYLIGFFLGISATLAYYFAQIYTKMNKYHAFEFDRTKKAYKCSFIWSQMCIWVTLGFLYGWYMVSDSNSM